ncbi:phage holin family protein [Saccharothrix sp.]|uniref:phage holin family protein n=1 Tax=Saccharothrix sp. TaxID=1873460 RepID=UPI0028112AE5|nr:phage holin family protein [Saccharothrix sp.]
MGKRPVHAGSFIGGGVFAVASVSFFDDFLPWWASALITYGSLLLVGGVCALQERVRSRRTHAAAQWGHGTGPVGPVQPGYGRPQGM